MSRHANPLWFLFLVIAGALAPTQAAENLPAAADAPTVQDEPVVHLPPFPVAADLCQLRLYGRVGILDYVVAGEVTPKSKLSKMGLREGDRLMTVDGRTVAGMKVDEFLALAGRRAASTTLTFEGKRRLGLRTVKIDLVLPPTKPAPNMAQ